MTKEQFNKFASEAEKIGATVTMSAGNVSISYWTQHGGEENIEVGSTENLADYLRSYCEDYDPSYETYIWLDNTGHGTNGAPYDMRDILSDKEEFKEKIGQLAAIAA